MRGESGREVVRRVGPGREPRPYPLALRDSGVELERVLSQLTQDFEQFDSMIRNQRHLLQQRGAGLDAFDNTLICRASMRISAGGAEIVTRALRAFEALCGVSQTGEFISSETFEQLTGGRPEMLGRSADSWVR
jgi:hypothetical protein